MPKITEYRIVISRSACMNERRAAAFISQSIRLVTGKKPQTVYDDTPVRRFEIAVGKTTRELADGLVFERSRERVWEYEIRNCGDRVYVVGFGCPDETERPYTSAYRLTDDGANGTVFAAYKFVEEILGCDFIYSTYRDYPDNPDAELPDGYCFSYTKERLRAELPMKTEGAAIYSIPSCEELNCNMSCTVFRTRAGRLAVLDGGHTADAEHIVRALEALAPEGEKPVVSAWLFSHLHEDHYGVYAALCTDPALRGRVRVEDFYCCLLSEEFYTKTSREASPNNKAPRDILLSSGETLGATVHTVACGDTVELDEMHFEVLHVPDEADARQMNINDSSVVWKLTYDRGQTLLFLSDSEFLCSNDLLRRRGKLKSDVVQVGHHGCGNVSSECYRAIDAKVYLWQTGDRFWYSDNGEGLNTHNTGVIRTRNRICELGALKDNIYRDTYGILTLELPVAIAEKERE